MLNFFLLWAQAQSFVLSRDLHVVEKIQLKKKKEAFCWTCPNKIQSGACGLFQN